MTVAVLQSTMYSLTPPASESQNKNFGNSNPSPTYLICLRRRAVGRLSRTYQFQCSRHQEKIWPLQDLISDLLAGFSSTIVGYGLTRSGKSTTLLGYTWQHNFDEQQASSLVIELLNGIFRCELGPLKVAVSVWEVYCGETRDLLRP